MLNFMAILVASFIPLVVGFIWYHPKVMGNIWRQESGVLENEDDRKGMWKNILVTLIAGFFGAFTINFMVVHQMHLHSLFANVPNIEQEGNEWKAVVDNIMANYGSNFRTFKHGAFHAFMTGLTFVTPIIAVNSMYEKRSFKYIAIHAAYWIICITIMGGIVSAWQ